jgi:hypothetical protein
MNIPLTMAWTFRKIFIGEAVTIILYNIVSRYIVFPRLRPQFANTLAGYLYFSCCGTLAVAYQIQCRLSEVALVRARGFDHTVQAHTQWLLAIERTGSGSSSDGERDCNQRNRVQRFCARLGLVALERTCIPESGAPNVAGGEAGKLT